MHVHDILVSDAGGAGVLACQAFVQRETWNCGPRCSSSSWRAPWHVMEGEHPSDLVLGLALDLALERPPPRRYWW
jgi:hypothetical protein